MPTIPALRKLRQEDPEFKANWTTQADSASKKTNKTSRKSTFNFSTFSFLCW
jgi:hypothetical protein